MTFWQILGMVSVVVAICSVIISWCLIRDDWVALFDCDEPRD